MKLRKKTISIYIIAIVTVLVFAVIVGEYIFIKQIAKLGGHLESVSHSNTEQNPMISYAERLSGAEQEFLNEIESDSSLVLDKKTPDRISKKINNSKVYLFIYEDGKCIYTGNQKIYDAVKDSFEKCIAERNLPGDLYIDNGENSLLLRRLEIKTDDTLAHALLALDITMFIPEVRGGFIKMIVAFVIINVLLGVCMIFAINRILLKPIKELITATHKIRGGDLDFVVKKTSADEIGQLQEDFEAMRVYLKESTEKNIKNAELARDAMSNISHDLKTPLTAIKGYSEGILDGVADTDEKKRKYVKTIHNKACAMEELVEDLSYFSKLDNSAVAYSFRLIPIKEFIKDCIDDVAVDFEVSDIKLIQSYDASCENVQAIIDSDEIRRVLLNIMGNSAKYMDKDYKEIEVSIKCDAEFACVSIKDNGRGISEEDLPRIFDRFYRADSSRGTRMGGTGLGLAIAKSIIEDHGGEISAESVLGEGTTIRFTVPRDRRKE